MNSTTKPTKINILENWDNPEVLESYLGQHFFNIDFIGRGNCVQWRIEEEDAIVVVVIHREHLVKFEVYKEGQILHSIEK